MVSIAVEFTNSARDGFTAHHFYSVLNTVSTSSRGGRSLELWQLKSGDSAGRRDRVSLVYGRTVSDRLYLSIVDASIVAHMDLKVKLASRCELFVGLVLYADFITAIV
jgi:hypothetical protein